MDSERQIIPRRNKGMPHEYKRGGSPELGFDALHSYSSKDSILGPLCFDGDRKVLSLESYSPFYPAEDDSFSNHLDDLLSFNDCFLCHGDPLAKTTNVITDATHPERPFSAWSSSPDSVDSDLDDESPLSTSTFSLSEDNDHMYYPHPDIYHLDEQKYPAHLYTPDHDASLPLPPPSAGPLGPLGWTYSPPFSPEFDDDYSLHDPPTTTPYSPRRTSRDLPEDDERTSESQRSKYAAHTSDPLPLSPPSAGPLASPGWTYPLSPDSCESPTSLFDDESSFTLHDPPTTIPCSPSRRRSRDLPEDEDQAPESQRFVRLRSLPGAETDDDLIPTELASKDYIPDPSIAVPTTPAPDIDGLLLLDLLPARSPSPEDFTLDPTIFAELAGQEVGVEMQRIHELRERTGRTEKERFREISALLRLKMEMLGSPPRPDHHESSEEHELESAPCSSDSVDTTTTPAVAKSPPRPKITNMAQLVANMVFHRQQDILRRSPPRTRTWPGQPHTSKTSPTPRSPLRQMSLPTDLEGEDEEEASSPSLMEVLDESPLPLSPLVLTDSPLGLRCLPAS